MAGRTRSPGALATDAVLPPHLILRLRHRLRRSRSTFGGASKSHWACTACRGLPALPVRNDVVRLRIGRVTPCAPLVLRESCRDTAHYEAAGADLWWPDVPRSDRAQPPSI